MELLNKIQQELNAPKGQRNDFGKYNYRSCEDILTAVKPLLGSATIKLTDEVVCIGDRYYVKADAVLVDGKEVASATAYAREQATKKGMDEAQITGAASSYARKYALNGLFAIDDTKDPDSHDNRSTSKPAPKKSAPAVPAKPARAKDQYIKEIDHIGTSAELVKWSFDNKDSISNDLNNDEKDLVRDYYTSVLGSLKNVEAKL